MYNLENPHLQYVIHNIAFTVLMNIISTSDINNSVINVITVNSYYGCIGNM